MKINEDFTRPYKMLLHRYKKKNLEKKKNVFNAGIFWLFFSMR